MVYYLQELVPDPFPSYWNYFWNPCTVSLKFILILSRNLCVDLSSHLLRSGLWLKFSMHFLPCPYVLYVPSVLSWMWSWVIFNEEYKLWSFLLCNFFTPSIPVRLNFVNTFSVFVLKHLYYEMNGTSIPASDGILTCLYDIILMWFCCPKILLSFAFNNFLLVTVSWVYIALLQQGIIAYFLVSGFVSYFYTNFCTNV